MKRIAALAGLALLLGCTPPAPSPDAARPPAPAQADIGYPSPQSALQALRRQPGVRIAVGDDGWTHVEDRSGRLPVLWSFPPEGDPAYPSALRRALVVVGDTLLVNQRVMCLAPRPACEAVVQRGAAMNERFREELSQQPGFVSTPGVRL